MLEITKNKDRGYTFYNIENWTKLTIKGTISIFLHAFNCVFRLELIQKAQPSFFHCFNIFLNNNFFVLFNFVEENACAKLGLLMQLQRFKES